MSRLISWFSCGAASAIATKLEPTGEPTYCLTGSEHPDNERFATDCERWFGRPIVRLKSERYADTWDVWTRRRYLAGIDGALCTTELKIMVHITRPLVGDADHDLEFRRGACRSASRELSRTHHQDAAD